MKPQEIVSQALEIKDPDKRARYIDEVCGDDPTLREQILLLIEQQQDGEDDFDLNTEAAELQLTTAQPLPMELTGTSIGPYKLMEQIGEGGMGVVYVAEQQKPVRRRVALKVIKPGMDSKEVMARFEAERQALAMMEHPNIARVLDAGASDAGRPYFVMELVRGIPITEFCDKNRLAARERLELFVDVTQAIQHAHQKGIIHRDIKPSNVLVTLHDVKPVVKVIDFGVAKAVNQQLTEQTIYTKFTQMVGTPLYMSPEQAEMSGLDIDTRSDIYSMGVLLYELLTGGTPFDRQRIKKAAYDEVRRIIREEEPHRPSTRISTLGETADSVSQSRGTDPRKLSHQLRGDLDWIVMKALDKDRTRRYETANGLGMDIRRYLRSEPVLASPPSTLYRLKKLIRRNRGLFAMATAITLLLIAGVAGTSMGLVSAMRANETIRDQNTKLDQANRDLSAANASVLEKNTALAAANESERTARRRADGVKNYLVDAFRKVDPDQDGRFLRVVEILDRSVVELAEKLADDPQTQADLLAAIGRSYRGLGMHREALRVFQKERALRAQLGGTDDAALLMAMYFEALCLYDDGKYDESIKLTQATLDKRRQILGRDHPATLNSMNSLALAYTAMDKSKEALALHEEILAMRRQRQGDDAPETLLAVNNLATAYQTAGRLNEALELFKANLEKRRQVQGEDHRSTLLAMDRLGSIYIALGQPKQAVPLYEQALEKRRKKLGDDHPGTLESLSGLGFAYRDAGRLDDAERLLVEALEKKRAKFGDDHPTTFAALNSLARIYLELGQFDKALPLVKEGYEKNEAKFGASHERTRRAMNTLGMTYYKVGQPEEALKVFEKLLELYRADPGDDHPTTNTIANNLGMTYRYVGRWQDAEPLFKKTLEWRRQKIGVDHPKTMASMANLAGLYRSLGRYKEAVDLGQQALKLHRDKLTEKHRQTLSTMSVMANIYLASGQWRESLELSEQALTATKSHLGEDHPDVSTAISTLGMCYFTIGRADDAEKLIADVLQRRKDKLGAEHPSTVVSMLNLSRVYGRLKKVKQALPLAQQAQKLTLQARGPDHPTTLKSFNVLANVLHQDGQRAAAIAMLQETLKKQAEILGDDHPATLKSRHDLAIMMHSSDNNDEAVRLLSDTIARRTTVLGSAHPHRRESMLLMTRCKIATQDLAAAEQQLKALWQDISQPVKQELLVCEQVLLTETAQAFVALYQAWEKPEQATKWMLLAKSGPKRKASVSDK